MITFLNGPAKDQSFTLRRAPYFLRVAYVPQIIPARWDALDLLEDEPMEGEILYAYVLANQPMRGFIDGKNYCGPFISATYRLVAPQPTDAEMRTTEAWRTWCEANKPKP